MRRPDGEGARSRFDGPASPATAMAPLTCPISDFDAGPVAPVRPTAPGYPQWEPRGRFSTPATTLGSTRAAQAVPRRSSHAYQHRPVTQSQGPVRMEFPGEPL